jgi:hypothetical protein
MAKGFASGKGCKNSKHTYIHTSLFSKKKYIKMQLLSTAIAYTHTLT